MIVGGYTLDLYCDRHKGPQFDHEKGERVDFVSIPGQDRSECMKTARSLGWIFHREGSVSCPACAEVRRKL
jgi:hypothetical protein